MRTKEIELIFHDADLEKLEKGYIHYVPLYSPGAAMNNEFKVSKAKLLIELPEKKVTISEGDLDMAMNKVDAESMSWDNFKFVVKTKLFKDAT